MQARQRQSRRRRAALSTTVGSSSVSGSEADVGRCLRHRRGERHLSLRALAEQSGVSVNTLSLIENGKVSPSVSTLQRIAQTLQVPITALFESEVSRSDLVLVRSDGRLKVAFSHGSLEDLGAGMADRTLEPFVISLDPGADSGPRPIVHAGQEFVLCLDGQIDYVIEDGSYALEPGDSLLFDANLPHRWLNKRPAASKALMVLCPFEGRDRPTLRHFGMGEGE
jgi:transcriptional regulator with XRE-family HTH domain